MEENGWYMMCMVSTIHIMIFTFPRGHNFLRLRCPASAILPRHYFSKLSLACTLLYISLIPKNSGGEVKHDFSVDHVYRFGVPQVLMLLIM